MEKYIGGRADGEALRPPRWGRDTRRIVLEAMRRIVLEGPTEGFPLELVRWNPSVPTEGFPLEPFLGKGSPPHDDKGILIYIGS